MSDLQEIFASCRTKHPKLKRYQHIEYVLKSHMSKYCQECGNFKVCWKYDQNLLDTKLGYGMRLLFDEPSENDGFDNRLTELMELVEKIQTKKPNNTYEICDIMTDGYPMVISNITHHHICIDELISSIEGVLCLWRRLWINLNISCHFKIDKQTLKEKLETIHDLVWEINKKFQRKLQLI